MESNLLSDFLLAIRNDPRIGTTHIGVYVALLHLLNESGGIQPIIFKREQVMVISRISGQATYHQVMRDLNEGGYVQYEARYNRKGNLIFLRKCQA